MCNLIILPVFIAHQIAIYHMKSASIPLIFGYIIVEKPPDSLHFC